MQIESRKNNRNKNAKRLNLLKGRQPRNPSQTNGGAKIRINSEIAIPKLKKLAQDYIGVADPQGFLTDLRIALGIPNSQGASKYGEVTIPKEDGSELKASLRITNHQANAEQYIKHNANYEYNLSIVVRRKERRNTFTPHEDVRLDEYVYYGKNIAQVENPLSQIVNGIVEFLQNGKYEDTTGVALKNTSPITTENKELNCNLNMNKKLIRLTESDLHRIVKESVNRLLEGTYASHVEPIQETYKTVSALYEMWSKVNSGYGADGIVTDESRKIMAALLNVIRTIEQVNNDSIDDGDEEGINPYDLPLNNY